MARTAWEKKKGLKGLDAIRVDAANAVYSNTCKIIRHALLFDLCCKMENPDNSQLVLVVSRCRC